MIILGVCNLYNKKTDTKKASLIFYRKKREMRELLHCVQCTPYLSHIRNGPIPPVLVLEFLAASRCHLLCTTLAAKMIPV